MVERHAGDSAEQREAEAIIVETFGRQLGCEFRPLRVDLANGVWVEVDAASEDEKILCEAWAHIGPPKSAQKNKVMTDAMKLLLVERQRGRPYRKYLVFGDAVAASRFTGDNWMAEALRRFGIAVEIVELPSEVRERIKKAQSRQYR